MDNRNEFVNLMYIWNFFLESGIFASGVIYKGTFFGPFQGDIIHSTETGSANHLDDSWEIFKNGNLSHFVCPTPSKHCWMRLVNCARYKKEQNLAVVQKNYQIYYEALEDIQENTELLVWYGDHYTNYMGIPLSINKVTVNEQVTTPLPSPPLKILEEKRNKDVLTNVESDMTGKKYLYLSYLMSQRRLSLTHSIIKYGIVFNVRLDFVFRCKSGQLSLYTMREDIFIRVLPREALEIHKMCR